MSGSVVGIDRRDWEDRRNPARAVAAAKALYRAALDGNIDPATVISELEVGAEPLWDAEDGDPGLVLQVATVMQRDFIAAEHNGLEAGTLGLHDPARIALRSRPLMLLARAQYRSEGQGRSAFETLLALLTWLENYVEGREQLQATLARDANPAAEAAVAVLGLLPAAFQQAALPRTVHEQYRATVLRYVRAYVGNGTPRAIYPRTPALAAQAFYLAVRDRRAGEEHLVRALYALDLSTRPQHARGQATRGRRDAEFARYCDDLAGFERNRRAGEEDLVRFPLPRHRRVHGF